MIIGEVPTLDLLTNILTKPLFTIMFCGFWDQLRVVPIFFIAYCNELGSYSI